MKVGGNFYDVHRAPVLRLIDFMSFKCSKAMMPKAPREPDAYPTLQLASVVRWHRTSTKTTRIRRWAT
jgi:hypothetical protein